MHESRTFNSLRNMTLSLGMQLTLLILTFVTRTLFISFLGEDYLGISDLYSNILSILSLSDLGINTVMIYSLYKPLAENDRQTLVNLITYFKKIYNVIALVIFALGLVCLPFLQHLVKGSHLELNSLRLYFVLFLVNTSLSYFNVYKSTLINADQKFYIIKAVDFTASVLLNVGQILILCFTHNYVLYLLLSIALTLLKNLFLSLITQRKYPFMKVIKKTDVSAEYKKELVKKTKSVFLYRVSTAIMNSTDNILISVILGTVVVGRYSNYLMIVTAVNTFIMLIAQSLLASIGNLHATADDAKKLLLFRTLVLFFWGIATFCTCCYLSVFNDFLVIWLHNFDAQYVLPFRDVAAISFNFFVGCILSPIWMFRESTGLFSQVKFAMTVAAVLNIILSIFLGHWIGLAGIVAATALSKLLTVFWFEPRILFSQVFKTGTRVYWISLIRLFACAMLSVAAVLFINSFIFGSIFGIVIKIFISLTVCLLVFALFNIKSVEGKYILGSIKGVLK